MILIAHKSKPFLYTAKGTPRRNVTLNAYEDEINELYRDAEKTALDNVGPPADWSYDSLLPFVRQVVCSVVPAVTGDADNIFQLGCDRFAGPHYNKWHCSGISNHFV